jgi:hypothetical protein
MHRKDAKFVSHTDVLGVITLLTFIGLILALASGFPHSNYGPGMTVSSTTPPQVPISSRL